MATRSTKKRMMTTTPLQESDKGDIPARAAEIPGPTRAAQNTPASRLTASQDDQLVEIEELKARVLGLADEVQAMKLETARNAAFQKAIGSVKDEVIATKAMLAAQSVGGPPVEYAAGPRSSVEEDCGCPPCQCVHPKCCCFDVIMTHFRVVHMQLEPTDTNLVPTDVLELRFFASIDPINNLGAIIPDPTGWVTGHKGLLEPVGMWVPVYRNIGQKCLPKGTTASITIELIVIEVETPAESAVLNRDEYGSASETVTLDCCYSNYPPIVVTVPLTGGGLNLAPGVIDAKFAIAKKC